MAENIVDNTFKLLKSDEKFKSNVNLYEFYDVLGTRFQFYANSEICRICQKNNQSVECINCNLQKILNDLNYLKPMFENRGLYNSTYYDYFMYWIYGKIVDSNRDGLGTYVFFSSLKNLLDNSVGKYNYKDKYLRIYDKRVLKKKKDLFDFLAYYDFIKNKLTNDPHKASYCKYIEYMFELYKAMDQDHTAKSHEWYDEELKLFKNKFMQDDKRELFLLDSQCSEKCLKYVFDSNNNLCPLKKENTEICMNKETDTVVVTPQRTLEYDHILKEFSAYKKYEEFSKVNGNDHKKYCNDICGLENNYKGIKDLCGKLAKNIENLSKDKESVNGCEHLYYWIYDHIWGMFSKNSKYINDKEVVLKLLNAGYNIIYELNFYECLYHYDLKESFDIWKDKKYLHDYFKNFYGIQDKISSGSYDCNAYYKYIDNINKLYENYIKECCYCLKSGSCQEYCRNYFLCNEKYNPYNLYLKLKCKYLSSGKDFKKVEKPLGVDHYVITASQKYAEGTCTKLACDPFYVITLSMFTVIGIFFILFAFYKFTPFGSWLNRKVHKKKKIKDYFPEEHDQELLVHDLEPTYINSRNRKLQLLYHSA
ncbi:PIR protein [Plasmodium ovale]|uniref:PIR protein n=1 Tax=Plasmodium ovale TaxID=36330 RepID=A0A1C3KHF0_PLAOA|nr:PIR protein [Plasmodium ovale]